MGLGPGGRAGSCPHAQPQQQPSSSTKGFSTTAHRSHFRNVQKLKMRRWLREKGVEFKNADADRPRYLGREYQPFPLNSTFASRPVLSEEAREAIYNDVVKNGMDIKSVSASYSVDIRRVAAVVRMMTIQRRMEEHKEPMAWPYAEAVMKMLPTWKPGDVSDKKPFEPVNEIHVHGYTMQQVFHPTSESREFTRADAAQAFGMHILPADKRVPIPELVQLERDVLEGVPPAAATQRFQADVRESEAKLKSRRDAKKDREKRRMRRVVSPRFEFRFKDVDTDEVGHAGRSRTAIGWRYGYPFPDRKVGQVKIPTSVGE